MDLASPAASQAAVYANGLRNEHPDDVVPRLKFLISNFCHILNVVCFLLGYSLASEFGRRGITQKKAYNKVKIEWSCTSAPTVCLDGMQRDNFTFTNN